MSDFYEVKLFSRDGKKASLSIKTVHPDAGSPVADKSFALMMLRDAAADEDPIGQEVSYDDILDAGWMKTYAAGFVLAVARTARGLDITVSDEAWLAHFKKGRTYASRAFRNAKSYAKHAPILREAKTKGAAKTEDGGFVWVPRSVFANHLKKPDACPEVLQVPAYGDTSYVALDAVKGDAKKARAWEGLAVREGSRVGALVMKGSAGYSYPSIFRYISGSYGVGGVELAKVERIGLKSGARKKDKLSYERILRDVKGVVVGATVEGNVATLRLEHGPKTEAELASAADVLWVLARAVPSYDNYDLPARRNPLAAAIRDQMKRLGQEPRSWLDYLEELAEALIVDYKVSKPARVQRTPKLDAMNDDEVKAFFLARPFGIGTLRVHVKDATLLAHLAPKTYCPTER